MEKGEVYKKHVRGSKYVYGYGNIFYRYPGGGKSFAIGNWDDLIDDCIDVRGDTSGRIIINEDKEIITYYLNGENKLVTDEPTESSPSRFQLKRDTQVKWDGISISRNKIIKNVTAELYIYFDKILLLRKITVNVTLFDETAGEAIAKVEKQLDRTNLFELILRRPNSPTEFIFDDAVGKEPEGFRSLRYITSTAR